MVVEEGGSTIAGVSSADETAEKMSADFEGAAGEPAWAPRAEVLRFDADLCLTAAVSICGSNGVCSAAVAEWLDRAADPVGR